MDYVFEWHEAKRAANIAKHGIDFIDAAALFGRRHIAGVAATVDGEQRQLIVGLLFGMYVTVVFTTRRNAIRIISARRARRDERGRYQEIFGLRTEPDAGEGPEPD